MKDVLNLLKEYSIYNPKHHNKSEHTYNYHPTESTIHFIAIDDPQKIRGPEWNYAWLNEANEMTYEDFKQIFMRMTGNRQADEINQIFMDFNPDDPDIWINTKIEQERPESDYDLIHSTYEDNPFLTKSDIRRIEFLRKNDPAFWTIYGLGEYGKIGGLVIKRWDTIDNFPKSQECQWVAYGLDFGFTNDPSTLIKVAKAHGQLYFKEIFYETGLVNSSDDPSEPSIISRFEEFNIPKKDSPQANLIIADSAEPKSIQEIYNKGYNIKGAIKGKDSVKFGLNKLNQFKINITKDSPNIIKEVKSYKWREDKNGNLLNKPIDFHNHTIDAGRYVTTYKETGGQGVVGQPDIMGMIKKTRVRA